MEGIMSWRGGRVYCTCHQSTMHEERCEEPYLCNPPSSSTPLFPALPPLHSVPLIVCLPLPTFLSPCHSLPYPCISLRFPIHFISHLCSPPSLSPPSPAPSSLPIIPLPFLPFIPTSSPLPPFPFFPALFSNAPLATSADLSGGRLFTWTLKLSLSSTPRTLRISRAWSTAPPPTPARIPQGLLLRPPESSRAKEAKRSVEGSASRAASGPTFPLCCRDAEDAAAALLLLCFSSSPALKPAFCVAAGQEEGSGGCSGSPEAAGKGLLQRQQDGAGLHRHGAAPAQPPVAPHHTFYNDAKFCASLVSAVGYSGGGGDKAGQYRRVGAGDEEGHEGRGEGEKREGRGGTGQVRGGEWG